MDDIHVLKPPILRRQQNVTQLSVEINPEDVKVDVAAPFRVSLDIVFQGVLKPDGTANLDPILARFLYSLLELELRPEFTQLVLQFGDPGIRCALVFEVRRRCFGRRRLAMKRGVATPVRHRDRRLVPLDQLGW
jgi:hypothetical protein